MLPNCEEPPAFDLSNSAWGDGGVVTIESTGCGDTQPGDELIACSLVWEMTPDGSDLEILVDEEYIIRARLCGAQLYLEGGWWLPVQDEGECTYEDDTGEEVGIQMGGSTLTVSDPAQEPMLIATGTLSVQGPCAASFATELRQFR